MSPLRAMIPPLVMVHASPCVSVIAADAPRATVVPQELAQRRRGLLVEVQVVVEGLKVNHACAAV